MKADGSDVIILIGAARSGTKFLRDILATPSRVRAVPYDINYVWRYGMADHPNDCLPVDLLTGKTKKFIKKTVGSLAKSNAGDIIIEKTVSNALRVAYVNEVFPKARFVHIIRDGRDVSESAMRLWQAKPDWKSLRRKLLGMPLSNLGYVWWFARNFMSGRRAGRMGGSVWGPRFEGIETVTRDGSLAETCALQWKHSVELASEALAQIAPERVFEIRYEDLVSDRPALRALLAGLDLPEKDQKAMLDVLSATLIEKGYSV